RRPAQPNSSRALHVLAEGGADEALARALAARYGKRPTQAELARLGDKQADVSLTVRLGTRSGEPLMALQGSRALPAGMQAKTTSDGATLRLGTTRLDLRASTQTAPVARPVNIRAQLKNQFQRADSNNDGFVDRMEARRSGFFATVFDAMDR